MTHQLTIVAPVVNTSLPYHQGTTHLDSIIQCHSTLVGHNNLIAFHDECTPLPPPMSHALLGDSPLSIHISGIYAPSPSQKGAPPIPCTVQHLEIPLPSSFSLFFSQSYRAQHLTVPVAMRPRQIQ